LAKTKGNGKWQLNDVMMNKEIQTWTNRGKNIYPENEI